MGGKQMERVLGEIAARLQSIDGIEKRLVELERLVKPGAAGQGGAASESSARLRQVMLETLPSDACVWLNHHRVLALYELAFPRSVTLSDAWRLRAAYRLMEGIPEVSRRWACWPHSGKGRRRGVAWMIEHADKGVMVLT